MTIIIAVSVVIAASAYYAYRMPASASLSTEKVTIALTETGFEPQDVRIRVGDSVTFVATIGKQFWPASNLHPDHSIYPDFDPKRPLRPDESWTFVFEKAGEWRYHDHLRSYFVGTIYVE
jgi:plastocyanin